MSRLSRQTKAEGTRLVNVFISVLYGEGFWVPKTRGHQLGCMLQSYMITYQRLAGESMKRGWNRFPMVPKAHMLAHCAVQMIQESQRGAWIINPLSMANQQQEDYIGRPCRLSRRVHARKLHIRVMQRSLLACHQAHCEDA